MLESFRCADPDVPWQAEVESFIRSQLFDWAFDPLAQSQDPRLLLLRDRNSRELIGVAAHEKCVMQLMSGGASFAASKLEVVAIARAWQGRSFPSGERASDVLMSAVMRDVSARVPPRAARVFAIIHQDNHRSLAMCKRHGLTVHLSRPDPRYVRLVTP